MKFFLLLFLYSTSLLAQDICGPKVKKEICHKALHEAIFFKDYPTIQKVIDKHGIGIIFENTGIRGPYGHVTTASFFNNTPFFKIISKSPTYPDGIPDKNQFLAAVLRNSEFREKDPDLLKLLFSNNDVKKNLDWWENEKWPYPLLEKLKQQASARKDKANFQELIKKFDEIDQLKKNICLLDSIDRLKQTMAKYSGMEVILKNTSNDLLSCAINSGNKDLALFLIENNFFYSPRLSDLVTKVTSGEVNKNSISLLSALEKKMDELKIVHPDKKIKQTIWTFEHLGDEIECLQAGSNTEILELKNFSQLAQKVVFSAFLKEAEKLKQATLTKDEAGKNSSILKIIELMTESGMPTNFQDDSGKTIMHHLSAFADFSTIEKLESTFNNEFGNMNYEIQDNQGNTPLHISVIHKNMSGSLALADEIVQRKNGFSYGVRLDVKMKNLEGKTPLEIVKNLVVPKSDKQALRIVKRCIKEHIDSNGRFDYTSH